MLLKNQLNQIFVIGLIICIIGGLGYRLLPDKKESMAKTAGEDQPSTYAGDTLQHDDSSREVTSQEHFQNNVSLINEPIANKPPGNSQETVTSTNKASIDPRRRKPGESDEEFIKRILSMRKEPSEEDKRLDDAPFEAAKKKTGNSF